MEEALQRVVARLRECPEVVAIHLFGSRARGEARPDSDVDLGVVLRYAWWEALPREHAAQEALAVMEAAWRAAPALDLDVVVLNGAHPAAAADALGRGRLLWCADRAELARATARAAGRYEDWRHLHSIAARAMRRHLGLETAPDLLETFCRGLVARIDEPPPGD